MKLTIKIVGALAIIVTSFVTTLWLLDRKPGTCPSGRVIAMNPPFTKFPNSDVAYFKELEGSVSFRINKPRPFIDGCAVVQIQSVR